MDCEKVSKLVDEAIEATANSWHEGIAAGDSTTALKYLTSAGAAIQEAMKEIRE